MSRFVELHHPNGEEVYVNPALVLTIERDGRGPGALITFAVPGRSWSDESSAEAEPYRLAVLEELALVASLVGGC